MFRVVLDPNVLIAALLSPRGAPAEIVERWASGLFDVVVSPRLLDELERALTYPKIAARIAASERGELIGLLRRHAVLLDDPADVLRTVVGDPRDDYLVALATFANARVLVSGDRHLLDAHLTEPPVLSPRAFLDALDRLGR